ncbi:Small nuclear ribonucleoprotein-associated protein B [Coemansia sp. RSA 1199]|nr:Small nuclear ribonucleoprotein-associated protein B [Coemansia sp. RSA 1199]
MSTSRSSKMTGLLNHRLRLTLADTRTMSGQMLAFDKHMNLVLSDCEEFRTIKAKSNAESKQIKRSLGLVILRGECVVSISVDGPPPAQQRARQAAGPGVARPAGRGMPVQPPGMPPVGLAGPVRGIGGPAASMMMPGAPAIAAGPVSFARPHGMPMPGAPQGFRPPMPPPGFRPPMPPPGMGPPGMGPPGFPPQPPAGFQPPYPRPPHGPPS